MKDDDRWKFSPGGDFHDNGERNLVVITHNYKDVNLINQGSINNLNSEPSDPFDILVLKYFKKISDEGEKLKVISMLEKMTR